MVFKRRKKKGAKETGLPSYDPKSKDFTTILHVGGTFTNDPQTKYVGGQTLCLDWCNADQISASVFDSYAKDAGVKGNLRYHLKMKDGTLKLFIDDDDLRKWARSFLIDREMDVYAELLVDDMSSEDSDFVGGSYSVDEDEDETMFVAEVECVESEFDAMDTANIIVDGFTSVTMSNEEAYKSEEDSDFVGGSVSVNGDDNIYDAEVECVESEFEAIDAANIIETARKEGEHVDAAECEHVDAAEGEHVDATEGDENMYDAAAEGDDNMYDAAAEGDCVEVRMEGLAASDIESFEDLNYCIGHEVTDSDDDVEEQTEGSHRVSDAANSPIGQTENVDDHFNWPF